MIIYKMDKHLRNMMYTAMKENNIYLAVLAFEHGARPNQMMMDHAAGKGYLRMIEWLAEEGILPTRGGATAAEVLKHQDMVNVLAEKGIYPDRKCVTFTKKVHHKGIRYFDFKINYPMA
jgi:hypothetical protein